jgi:heme/copper-type cytochrome/quinol oxidase subunit 2
VASADNAEMCGALSSDMDGTVYWESPNSDKLWLAVRHKWYAASMERCKMKVLKKYDNEIWFPQHDDAPAGISGQSP